MQRKSSTVFTSEVVVLVMTLFLTATAEGTLGGECLAKKLKALAKLEKALIACDAKAKATGDAAGVAACVAKAQTAAGKAFDKTTGCGETIDQCSPIAENCRAAITAALPDAAPNPCAAAKLAAVAKNLKAQLGCYSKAAKDGVSVNSACQQKAADKLSNAFARAGNSCAGSAAGVEAVVDGQCVTAVVGGEALVAAICPISSGCFQDFGDGTIRDNCTGLQWEKKTTAVGSGVNPADLHDVDNIYGWGGCCGGVCFNTSSSNCQPNAAAAATCAALSDSGTQACNVCASGTCDINPFGDGNITSVWDWLNQLNASNFAGHNDWRLPSEAGCNGAGVWGPPGYTCASSNPHELETILSQPYPCTAPCIDPIFGPTDGSTAYWSASYSVPYLIQEWAVEFYNGSVVHDPAMYPFRVRAVRAFQ